MKSAPRGSVRRRRFRRPISPARPTAAIALAWAVLLAGFAWPAFAADDSLSDVFGGVGTAERADDTKSQLAPDLAADEGTVVGQVIDANDGVPVGTVTVILIWPTPADGSEPRQEVQVTDAGGEYRFPKVPAGDYRLSFIKSGYRLSELKSFAVAAGQVNVADFPLPPKSADTSGAVLNLDAFVVEAAAVGDMMTSLELRMESDALVDVMGAEDLSKFAASDVADALKRVSGVNVVQGRFAVIRGLEDRYSSTTFNHAPIPSSDPLRQSVQLDLFPSDIVSGIVVQKTFEAPTPGNSGAGSIDIGTMGYPDEFTMKVGLGGGFNENAIESFLGYRPNSPVADFMSGTDVIESDINLSLGGRTDVWDRDFRFKAVFAREIDYETALGVQEGREPLPPRLAGPNVLQSGGLALRELAVSDGRFAYEQSTYTEQYTYFGSLGMDIDRDGNHRVDFTGFYTEKDLQDVQRLDKGYIPGFPYATTNPDRFIQQTLYIPQFYLAQATVGSDLNDFRDQIERPELGPLSFDPMVNGQSIVQNRKLTVFQLNGEHDLVDLVEGLELTWATNYARSQQDEAGFRARYWWELEQPFLDDNNLPIPPFPPRPEDLLQLGLQFNPNATGTWRTTNNDIIYLENTIDENQGFVRADVTYETDPLDWMTTKAGTGLWYEHSARTLEFVEYFATAPIRGRPGVRPEGFVAANTEPELGDNIYLGYGLNDLGTPGQSEFTRQILAGYFDLKLTLFDDVDVIGGVRLEDIEIISDNRPFTGVCDAPRGQQDGRDDTRSGLGCPAGFLPRIYPSRYLYLDRQDNPNNPFFRESPSFIVSGANHDELLNIDLPVQPNGFVDLLTVSDVFGSLRGEIDELKVFPMVSAAYRPLEGLTLRAAYSETAARPSFRELAYYASIVPGIPDRIVGNPFLQLSEVNSVDGRIEYFWGDVGDLFAIGVFYKTIQNPIELIVLTDPSVVNFPLFEGPFRVYRNNENEATLLGMEVEARVTLDLIGGQDTRDSFLQYFSVGGNYTYIDATVNRSPFEVQIASQYFAATPADIASGRATATQLPIERRLFNQPEWTANGDITFDQPDWGTTFTLSVFAISEVLNAAGAATPRGNGTPEAYVLDEFTDGYYQLDMVFGQSFDVPRVPGRWTARVSIKNLTDTLRGIVYDPEFTNQIYHQRLFTIGRDYSFTLQYQLAF